MADGLTTANLGPPDLELAWTQHMAYVYALMQCGLNVTALHPFDCFPDCTFIEDPAVLLPDAAVITRPGAESRRGETAQVEHALRRFFDTIHHIEAPGTLDGGDVMSVGTHYFIGLSERTNQAGASQLLDILKHQGLSGSTVPLESGLHLKSSVACLDDRVLLVSGPLAEHPAFSAYEHIVVPPEEAYAANALWLNGKVLLAAGCPKTTASIKQQGCPVISLDVSEFRKLDGGLSCLSLRF